MSDPELDALIDIVRQAAERIGELYRRHHEGGIAVDEKAPGDPVTEADRQANALICDALAKRFPDDPVIAEESVPKNRDELAARTRAERVFFVDPLDGTREFIAKNGEFAVMLGLACEGRAEAGVVWVAQTDELLAGRAGVGAFAQGASGERRALEVTACTRFPEATMLVSRSHRPAVVDPLRRRLGVGRLERCGSVGVKVGRLARGEAELYVHAGLGMKLWDSCAPEAILRGAGGRMSDLDGADIDYRASDMLLRNGLVATNGVLHAGVLSAIPWAQNEAARIEERKS